MNKKQIKAIENFQKSYDEVIKEGLNIIICDNSTFIYKVKDLDTIIVDGDYEYDIEHAKVMKLLMSNKTITTSIEISMFNNI